MSKRDTAPRDQQTNIRPATLAGALDGVRPSRARVGAAILLRLGSAASALAIPWSAGVAVRAVSEPGTHTLDFAGSAGLLLLAVAGFLTFEFIASITLAVARLRALAQLRTGWFDRLQRTKMQDYDESSRQDWLSLLTQDASRVTTVVTDLPGQLVFAGVLMSGAFAAMASLSFWLACAALAATPVVFFLARIVGRAIARASNRWRAREVALVQHTDQTFGALSAVKSFAAEDSRTSAYRVIADDIAQLGVLQQRYVALMGPMTQFVAFTALVVLAFAWNASVEELESAKLTTFVLYGLLLTVGLRTFASAIGSWSDARAALDRFGRAAAIVPEAAGGEILDEVAGELSLEGVEFSYAGRAPVFSGGVSLRLIAGDTTVVLGANGAGKTTLVSLLLRFREPDRGVVRLDGVDVSGLELAWYRRQFAVVHQDPVLMDGTLRENITLGRWDATAAQIETACEAALLDEIVRGLPRGLDTRIGDGGAQLSGGQRQRVALARAFLMDAPVLILDEATSMFDPEAERRFIERNREHFASKTVLWITHGAAPLAIADRVVEVRGGGFRAPLRPVEAHG